MPTMDGLTATEAVRARSGAPEVLVLTTFNTGGHVLRALRAGAAGFLLKDTPPEEIVGAVRRVARGHPVIDRLAGPRRRARRPGRGRLRTPVIAWRR